MPKINIEKMSSKSPRDSYAAIKNMLSDDPDLRNLDRSYQCQFDDASLSGRAKGQKFEATLTIAETGPQAKVQLEVQIPLMLTPFKGLIETTLTKKLEKALS